MKRKCNFFSVDFNAIDTNDIYDILDIHKYLMKGKYHEIKMFMGYIYIYIYSGINETKQR